jgi:hypothetical protein
MGFKAVVKIQKRTGILLLNKAMLHGVQRTDFYSLFILNTYRQTNIIIL